MKSGSLTPMIAVVSMQRKMAVTNQVLYCVSVMAVVGEGPVQLSWQSALHIYMSLQQSAMFVVVVVLRMTLNHLQSYPLNST